MSAISVKGIGKKYRLGHTQHYQALRDVLNRTILHPFERFRRNGKRQNEPAEQGLFWALKDISFDVKPGEVIGIIGRNGAGKSTLLKILSRVTLPTEGEARLNGRIGSLLEVGTGFHPELTGRENIYLNGAILGMKKDDIKRQFDEIAAFSEIEKFIDTPVKFYSSGMYVRLAFAVAAHLEPEILVVDEVLAVGDLAFQKKCLGKMGDVALEGRTVLLVSHQMNAIRKLCQRCIWLENGRIRMFGSMSKVVGAYESSFGARNAEARSWNEGANVKARFLEWAVHDQDGKESHSLNHFGPIQVKVTLQANSRIKNAHHGISLCNIDDQLIWAWAIDGLSFEPGVHDLFFSIPGLPVRPGSYSWKVSLYGGEGLLDYWHCIPNLIVETPPVSHPRDEWSGILNIPCRLDVKTGAVV